MKKLLFLKLKIIGLSIAMFFTFAILVVVPVYAWLSGHEVVVYAPINTSTSLYIGAGNEEDIRYLSFEGIDATSAQRYVDYVFSVTGEFVRHYKIQLAFTTNNEFTFDLFKATTDSTLASSDPRGTVEYVTHPLDGSSAQTITYYIATNGKINGSYRNQKGNDLLGNDSTSNPFYSDTYGSYTYVDKNAVPLYWQTNATIEAGGDSFHHFYILRLYIGNKQTNDRETDIICIAARVFSSQITE